MISPGTLNKLLSGKAFKAIAFGDSVTYGARCQGWYDQFGETWVGGTPVNPKWNSWANRMERLLTRINKNVTFMNKGTPGDTSAGGASRVGADVNANSPDLTFVGFGINDCNASVTIPTYTTNMQNIIDGIPTGEVVLLTPTPVAYTSTKWGWQYATSADAGDLASYASAVRSLAESNGLLCIDVWSMFQHQYFGGLTAMQWANNQGSGSTALDGEHPGELGHRMVFDFIRRELLGLRRVA